MAVGFQLQFDSNNLEWIGDQILVKLSIPFWHIFQLHVDQTARQSRRYDYLHHHLFFDIIEIKL